MVCYTIPTIAAIVHYAMRKNIASWRNSMHQFWLNLMLAGGAIFGIVDHLWNGELFLIGENVAMDIMLGVTITVVIFVSWAILVAMNRATSHEGAAETAE